MARSLLQHWQGHGLPLGKSVVDAYTDHWQHNPWLPQNGYGEVLVNPSTGFANACELGSTSNSPQ